MREARDFDCEFAENSYADWQPYMSCRKLNRRTENDECRYAKPYLCDIREPRKKEINP